MPRRLTASDVQAAMLIVPHHTAPRVSPANKRQQRQKAQAGAYRAAPHNYRPVTAPYHPAPRPAPRPASRPYTLPRNFHTDATTQSAGLKRADRYRTSRPYYKTFRSVWSQSPQVKRALAASRVAYQKSRAYGGERAVAMRTQGERPFERELRRGPDKLAGEAYGKYAKHLWKIAAPYYPDSKHQPKTKLDYGPQGKAAYAWVSGNRRNVVHVAPLTVRQFMLSKGNRGPSESLMLHEWVHTRQPDWMRSKAVREGGAEATDRLIAKRLGITYVPSPDSAYRRWARQQRRKGKHYLLHGQYH